MENGRATDRQDLPEETQSKLQWRFSSSLSEAETLSRWRGNDLDACQREGKQLGNVPKLRVRTAELALTVSLTGEPSRTIFFTQDQIF